MPSRNPPFSTAKLLTVGALAWLVLVTSGNRARMPSTRATPGRRPAVPGSGGAAGFPFEPGRGRMAAQPSQIPVRGWRDILYRTYREAMEDRITTVAAGITFYGLLALFPAVTALVSLYGLFADPATVRDHLFALSFMLPAGTFQIVEDQIGRILSQGTGALTFKLVLGLAIAVWGANAGMKAIMDGLNIAYEEEEKRSFLRLNAVSLALTAGALVAVLLAILAVTVAPAVIASLRLSGPVAALAAVLRWVVMGIFLTFGLSVLYRFGPSRAAPKWRWVTWGGAFAAILWIVISLGLSAYLSKFADYNATYGSLGAAIALMMWIWLSACAVLLGAELNAETEHQTALDSTTGAPVRMGLRGATMADTLGAPAP